MKYIKPENYIENKGDVLACRAYHIMFPEGRDSICNEGIKEIDNNFSLSNVIEADEDTILVFKLDSMLFKQEDLNKREDMLSTKFNHKCILLNGNMTLDKAIRADYAKGRDYTTTTYYDGSGNLVKEETTQYK